MPFSPSDFEWWMWALLAIGALVVCGVCRMISVVLEEKNQGGAAALFGFFSAVAGIGGAVIALIRLIKWVWG
jgi:hypothetical protein